MSTANELWPHEFGVELALATEWVSQAVGAPARFNHVLRNKLWGFTASFAASSSEHVVLKIAAPPLFPAAYRAHEAAHRVAPKAVPELLRFEHRDGQDWSLFEYVDGQSARGVGKDAVFGVVAVIAEIQRGITAALPPDVPLLTATQVAALLTDLHDQPVDLVNDLEGHRDAFTRFGEELDSLVPLSLDHVDLHLGNALCRPDGQVVILDWEEAVVSCPLFSFERLRVDAVDHGVAALAERAYAHALLPALSSSEQDRAMALARVLAPIKLAHEARCFAGLLGWDYPHTRLTTQLIKSALDATASLVGRTRTNKASSRDRDLSVSLRDAGSGEICRRVLDTLPAWFGMPEANDEYVSSAEDGCAFVAELDSEPVGLLVPVRHSDAAAEILLLAVAAPHRHNGIGRALVEAAEQMLSDEGVEALQVKTLSARHPDEGYEETRAFYRALGFVHLEEHPMLWGEESPALQMVKVLR